MSTISPEVFYKEVDAVIGWDIDGVLCPTRKVEKNLNKIVPGFIPWIQTMFQSPRGPFVNRRQFASYRFLLRRTINEGAVDAFLFSYGQARSIFDNTGTVVRNAIYTERPAPAKGIIFNQLGENLRRRGIGIQINDLVEGYFDNPLGSDHRNVKPNAARTLQELGIKFHLIEDKRRTAIKVKEAAPETSVYFVADGKGSEAFCRRNNLIPVYSAREFVEMAFESIRKAR